MNFCVCASSSKLLWINFRWWRVWKLFYLRLMVLVFHCVAFIASEWHEGTRVQRASKFFGFLLFGFILFGFHFHFIALTCTLSHVVSIFTLSFVTSTLRTQKELGGAQVQETNQYMRPQALKVVIKCYTFHFSLPFLYFFNFLHILTSTLFLSQF